MRVLTPLLKSGGYRVATMEERASGEGGIPYITATAGSEFLGYETSYYTVEERNGGGVRLKFSSAEIVRDGTTTPAKRPVAWMLQLPRNARYLRLLYLLRASRADHNMAVLATGERGALEDLTQEVQADPATGCQSRRGRVCEWIPAGIAVRPELKKSVDGIVQWTPAR